MEIILYERQRKTSLYVFYGFEAGKMLFTTGLYTQLLSFTA